jgi:hypothetical protein
MLYFSRSLVRLSVSLAIVVAANGCGGSKDSQATSQLQPVSSVSNDSQATSHPQPSSSVRKVAQDTPRLKSSSGDSKDAQDELQLDPPSEEESYMTAEEFKDWIEEVEYQYIHYHKKFANYKRGFSSSSDEHKDDNGYVAEYKAIIFDWNDYLVKERQAIDAWKEYGEKAYDLKEYRNPIVGTAPPAPPYPRLPTRPPLKNSPMPPM